MNKEHAAALLGFIGGYIYFQIGESKQSKNNNCSYLSPASTDVLAVVAGGLVAKQGFKYKDPILSFVGPAVLSIHTFQYLHFKNNK
jgi:hypothetical protein